LLLTDIISVVSVMMISAGSGAAVRCVKVTFHVLLIL